MKVVVGSNLRAEVRMKSGHSVWAKYREASEVIELNALFDDYWSSENNKFAVLGQSLSPTSSHRSDGEGQRLFPLESIVALLKCNSLQMIRFVPLLPLPIPAI